MINYCLDPQFSSLFCNPTNKYAKIILIKNGVRIFPKKNKIKKAITKRMAKTKVSSFEKIFFNKLFKSSSTFYI